MPAVLLWCCEVLQPPSPDFKRIRARHAILYFTEIHTHARNDHNIKCPGKWNDHGKYINNGLKLWFFFYPCTCLGEPMIFKEQCNVVGELWYLSCWPMHFTCRYALIVCAYCRDKYLNFRSKLMSISFIMFISRGRPLPKHYSNYGVCK